MPNTSKSWEREFDQWWLERFGCEYVGTFPQGDFYDFISHLLKERNNEIIEMIEGMKKKIDYKTVFKAYEHEKERRGSLAYRPEDIHFAGKVYNHALTDLKNKLERKEK